jgi:hypothetical protein
LSSPNLCIPDHIMIGRWEYTKWKKAKVMSYRSEL